MRRLTPSFSTSSQGLLLCCLLALGLLSACTRESGVLASPSRRVQVQTVTDSCDLPPIEAPGLLSRKTEATLSFKVGGVVEAVRVRAGDRVSKGQLLATLDLAESDAQVALARAGVERARRDAERMQRLHAEHAETQANVDNAKTALAAAEAALRIALFNRTHAMIVAPTDGRILSRNSEPNELIGAGQPVLRFASNQDGWLFKAGLIDRDARRLSPGDRAVVYFSGFEERTIEAHLHQIAEAADLRTHTLEAEFIIEGEPTELRSGAVGRVVLHKAGKAPRTQVPLQALLAGDGAEASVCLLEADGKTIRRVRVSIEALLDTAALLRERLPPGTKVVTRGAEYLRDGETVIASEGDEG